jgi:hypothetical protein
MVHPSMVGVVVVGDLPAAPAAEPAAGTKTDVAPVASTEDTGGGSALPWAGGGLAVLVTAALVLRTFAHREAGVPQPAR